MSTFLETLQGDSAILFGGSEGIARILNRRFHRIYAADPFKSLTGIAPVKLLHEGTGIYSTDSSRLQTRLPDNCDLLLFAFSLANHDDPHAVLLPWIPCLKDRGKVVVLEWYGGLGAREDSGQPLHDVVMNRLETAGVIHRPSSRKLNGWLRSAGLHNVRSGIEPSDMLFTDEDLAFLAAETLSHLVLLDEGDTGLVNRLRSEKLNPGRMIAAHGQYKQIIPVEEYRKRIETAGDETKKETGKDRPGAAKDLAGLIATVLGDEVDDPRETARNLLAAFGAKTLAVIHDPDALRKETGISLKHARRLLDAVELGRRLFCPVSEKEIEIHGPEDAWRYLKDEMEPLKREHFRGLYLNVKRRLEADEVISVGTLTSSLVHPREVFGPAIARRCHSVLIAHNHPSGDPEPSFEDIHLTRELAEAGLLLGIELLDHIIIGKDRYISLKERGHI